MTLNETIKEKGIRTDQPGVFVLKGTGESMEDYIDEIAEVHGDKNVTDYRELNDGEPVFEIEYDD